MNSAEVFGHTLAQVTPHTATPEMRGRIDWKTNTAFYIGGEFAWNWISLEVGIGPSYTIRVFSDGTLLTLGAGRSVEEAEDLIRNQVPHRQFMMWVAKTFGGK